MKRITSRQNAVVARYRATARGDEPAAMLLDGPHLVGEALTAGVVIRHALVATTALSSPEIQGLADELARRGVEVCGATTAVMDAASPVRSASPIVALADRPPDGASRLYSGVDPLIVIAVDVQDPGNLGAIVRVAEAGGANGVVVAGRSADPMGWKALRGSMGSALRLPLATQDRADDAVADARVHGCRIVAAVPRGGRPLFDINLRGAVGVLIGGEGSGLDDRLVAAADEHVTIPMETPVESLNASVSAALLVYEGRRQRRTAP